MGTDLQTNTMNALDIVERTFEVEQRMAKALISGSILPARFRNVGDVIILNEMSRSLAVPTVMLAQQMYIVKGSVGMSGQLVIALLNGSGLFDKPITWEEREEPWGIRAIGYVNGDRLEGQWIDDALITSNGWKSNTHWINNRELMARYRSASWFGRLYAPQILMGFKSEGEIEDANITEITAEESQTDIASVFAQDRTGAVDVRKPVKDTPEQLKERQEPAMDDLNAVIEDPEPEVRVLNARDRMELEAKELGMRFRSDIKDETLSQRIADEFKKREDALKKNLEATAEEISKEAQVPEPELNGNEIIYDMPPEPYDAVTGEVEPVGKQKLTEQDGLQHQSNENMQQPRGGATNSISANVANRYPDLILLGIARKHLNDFTKWRGLNSYNIEEFIQNKNTARADINRYYGLSEIQDV